MAHIWARPGSASNSAGPDGVWVAGGGRFARLDTTTGDLLEVIEVPGGGHAEALAKSRAGLSYDFVCEDELVVAVCYSTLASSR